ncbi:MULTISPECIES: DUF6044 family protein [Bacillaceae]|uniref:DUF6044 family protein n=1 Tax=Bacillaceae TaxID=186817 RepID=UPI002041F172|nr:DUF6044 family protein [Caldibacillus thermoamylovorans]MCM3055877.1 DUF6044 family protein [Caldibacillus thermoamylovorans]
MDFNHALEKRGLFIAYLCIFAFVAPLFLLGEHAHIRVHDNLDSNLAWYKVLVNSGEMFGPVNAVIPQVINGLPRYAFGSEWSGIVWLHALFPTMTAYALSQTITRVFAFLGMYLLLKEFFIKSDDGRMIRIGVSLAFALTPFWPSGMLCTLGHPLALWAFLKIRSGKDTWKEWLTLGLLPFYSGLVLGFFFFLVAVSFLWLYDLFKTRQINWRFLGSIAFMVSVFLFVEYRLVYSTIFSDDVSHRVEFISSRHDFFRSLRLSLKNFLLGHTHVMTVHTIVIIPILFIALILMIYRKEWRKEKLFIFLLVLNYLLSLWYALWFNNLWIPLKQRYDIFNTFNFARFHFLRPLIIYLSFAIGCSYLWKIGLRRLVKIAVVAQIIVLVPFNEEIHYRFIHHTPTFEEFYAEKLFSDIDQYIGKPKSSYRVASIGLHPAVAQYNGFYTLDTYNNFYPLTYKYQFRKIIRYELEKNKTLQRYFDEWGSRCYIFVDELGKKFDYKKSSKKRITNLHLDTAVFYEMGGRYLFSSVPIDNAAENHLALVKSFEDDLSYWKIYLYAVTLPEETAKEDI